jgi:DNA invertase Pin-like site-specific DNA recombinase
VWRLDRFGRSLLHLLNTIKMLGDRGVAFKSLNDPIDTSNASGRLVFHVLASLAEFERALLVERTQAGLEAAKRRGAKLGRRFALEPAQAALLKQMIQQGSTPKQMAQAMGIGIATVYRYLNR